MERYTKYKRKSGYLYFGLIFAAAAMLMLVVSIHGIIHGETLIVSTTGLGAGILWSVAAVICLRQYYIYNRAEIMSLDNAGETPDKNNNGT